MQPSLWFWGWLWVVCTGWIGAGLARAEEPRAPSSFEEALELAEPPGDLAMRLDPLFADCKRNDDFDARLCSALRDQALERLKDSIFVGLGDDSALTWTPWSTADKQVGLEVHGCIACGRPLAMADRARFVTTRVPKAIKAGNAVGLDVGFHEVPFADSVAAAKFTKDVVPRLRVQFVYRVGTAWKSGSGEHQYEGVLFVPFAHRVFDRCTGKVYASEPKSERPAEPLRDGCPENDQERRERESKETLPDQLSREQVVKAMRSIETKVRDCMVEFDESATAVVKMVVDGEGGIAGLALQPPYDKVPAGFCIKRAVQGLQLPHFSGEKMTITYPFVRK